MRSQVTVLRVVDMEVDIEVAEVVVVVAAAEAAEGLVIGMAARARAPVWARGESSRKTCRRYVRGRGGRGG